MRSVLPIRLLQGIRLEHFFTVDHWHLASFSTQDYVEGINALLDEMFANILMRSLMGALK